MYRHRQPVVLQDSLQFLPNAENTATAIPLQKKTVTAKAVPHRPAAAGKAPPFCSFSPTDERTRKRGACFLDENEEAAAKKQMKKGRERLLQQAQEEAAKRKKHKKQKGSKREDFFTKEISSEESEDELSECEDDE